MIGLIVGLFTVVLTVVYWRITRPKNVPPGPPRVILSQNELWKEHRRFALSTLRDFGMGKSWLEDAVLDEVEDLCQRIVKQNGQPFDPKKLFSCSVANVICALIFGKRFSHDNEKFARFSTITNENIQEMEKIAILDGIPFLKYLPGPMAKILAKVIDDQMKFLEFLEELTEEHENQNGTNQANTSFIDSYNQEARRQKQNGGFQLMCILSDLFAAGSESTSTTLLWSLLLMMENPTVTEKVKAEIASHIKSDQPVRMSDRTLLPFTEATIMEVQRVASLVPINVPHMTLSDLTIDGYNVPKGTTLLTNNYFIHRDPRYWKNPDQFDPQRFLDAKGKVFRPDGFVPFSVGKRACLGESLAKMELWLFFANLMHYFSFRLPPNSTATSKECNFAIVLSPHPYEIIFERRY